MSHTCDRGDDACRACAAEKAQHALLRAAMTSGDRLDDITRVRIWSKLETRLAAPPIAKPRRNRAVVLGGGALAAAAAIAIVLVQRGGDEVLEAPAGAVLTTAIGPHARASLVGPARVEVVGTAADATTVRLRAGAMYAEFEGGAGRSLRIEAPGATVEVVGTLFAIEIRDAGTCVSVAHGRVRVTTATGVIAVGGGESMCTDGDHRVAAIAPATRAALARQAVVLGDREAIARVDGVATSAGTVEPSVPPSAPVVPVAPAIAPAPVAPAPVAPTVITPPVIAPPPPMVAPAPRPAPARPERPAVTAARVDRAPVAAEAEIAPPAAPVAAPPVSDPASPPAAATVARTAADLYRVAENALAAREIGAADRALARLLDEFPTARETELALYERARIAYQRRAWADARRQLDRLAQIPHASLAEPGQYLACRVAVMSGDEGAARCLTAYRAAYPTSPHRTEALALLIQLTHAAHGCAGARALIDELVAIAPTGTLAIGWQARCKDAP
ncbi:MAG: FecR family protein [Deltaproteobacteria bacterium]|nr:FecR family protein [Deltaproteobacteria bacterium]